jgi:hypothetical protein
MHDPSHLPSAAPINDDDDDIIKAVPPEFANEPCLPDLPASPIPPPPGKTPI